MPVCATVANDAIVATMLSPLDTGTTLMLYYSYVVLLSGASFASEMNERPLKQS